MMSVSANHNLVSAEIPKCLPRGGRRSVSAPGRYSSAVTGRYAAAAVVLAAVVLAGCAKQDVAANNPDIEGELSTPSFNPARSADLVAVVTTPEPGVVELQKATARMDENRIVRFEVAYRFTSGSPVKTYLCNIGFPGTEQYGVKPLESFELQQEGTFRAGIEVGDNPVTTFEMTFSEADSPERGYHLISNTLAGPVEQ